MDPFEELENMAFNAAEAETSSASPEEIATWQRLFSYSYDQAISLIGKEKDDYTRSRISDEYCKIIGPDLEGQGYDKLAYEHELANNIGQAKANCQKPARNNMEIEVASAKARGTLYLIKLEGPLCTPEEVGIAANLPTIPESTRGESEHGDASFCIINGLNKNAIESWLSSQNLAFTFKPTSILYGQMASKDLFPLSPSLLP